MRSQGITGLLALTLAVGCTTANVGEGGDDIGGRGRPDGGVEDGVDGGTDPTGDGGTEMTLSQTTSDSIVNLNSIGCIVQDGDGNPVRNRDNAYYRVFDLPAAGVTGPFEVRQVVFGIEQATSPTGSQPANLALHTLEGALEVGNLTPLASVDLTLPNQMGTLYTASIEATVPAGAKLVVELFVPDSPETGDTRLFFIGSNGEGQTSPGYLRAIATGCNINEPTDLATLGFPNMHMIMKVVGER